jgi:hypothetical protein
MAAHLIDEAGQRIGPEELLQAELVGGHLAPRRRQRGVDLEMELHRVSVVDRERLLGIRL